MPAAARSLTLALLAVLVIGAAIGCDSTPKPSALGPRESDYLAVVDAARSVAGTINGGLAKIRNPSPQVQQQMSAFQAAASDLNAKASALETRIKRADGTQLLALETREVYLQTQRVNQAWAGFLEALDAARSPISP